MRDTFRGPEVGQVVLPAPPGGSPASQHMQVNALLTRSNDLPYVFVSADLVTDPRRHMPAENLDKIPHPW